MNCGHGCEGWLVGLIKLAEADVECVLRSGFHRVPFDACGDEIADYRGVWLAFWCVSAAHDEVQRVAVVFLAFDGDGCGCGHIWIC